MPTFLLITEVSMEVENQELEYILSIWYLVKFKKDYIEIKTLIDSGSKINAMTLAYIAIFGLCVYFTNVRAQKIDRSTLLTYSIVLAIFHL